MPFEGDIFKKNLPVGVEDLIEGNCWALNCAIFSYLSGDLHHGSTQYIIEGTRIAFTKYAYQHKFKFFEDKIFGYVLNRQLMHLGYIIKRPSKDEDFVYIQKELLKYIPKIKEKHIKKDEYGIKTSNSIFELATLYFVLDFLTQVNPIMSRMEADPIGTFMFDTLTKFKNYLSKMFKSITPKTEIKYQSLFNDFLNKRANLKIKKQLIYYQKAKMISLFDIETMLDIGENEYIEFKEKVSSRIVNSVIAFCNTTGGRIIVGISEKKKNIGIKNIDKNVDIILNLIRGNCNPQINPYILPQKFRKKNLIVIEIFPTKKVITDNENNCYIRIGKQNRRPSPEEYEELLEDKKQLEAFFN